MKHLVIKYTGERVTFMDIEIHKLNVEVDNKKVLKDFNININSGSIHVLMGPNGVGKSTLSKVIMGDEKYKITAGDILCNTKSILNLTTDERAKLGIFLSFQNPIEVEGISNSEFIRSSLNSNTEKPVGLYDFIMDMEENFKNLKLDKSMMHRSINSNFSGGERKKNEILQMKMLKPKFIILDELDSGLDVDSLKIVCDNVNQYIKENPNTSVLLITHYARILQFIKPDFVHVFVDGKIVESGDLSLALKIDKEGYNLYLDKAHLVSEV